MIVQITLIQTMLLVLVSLLLMPCFVILVECFSALSTRRKQQKAARLTHSAEDEKPIVVLMPAHNEAAGIIGTINNLLCHLGPQDRLMVVADNCTDHTAQLAKSTGVMVRSRHNNKQRGKGYALDYGLQEIAKMTPTPAAVVIIDADCRFQKGSVHQLANTAIAHQRPAQAIYLIERSPQASLVESLSAFAFKVKNLVRPLGLYHLHQPCLLTGSGMAIPWSLLSTVDLASGSLVEDMQLGFDFAIAGTPPILCQNTTTVGPLPPSNAAAKIQRTRWEHGHLHLIGQYCPKLISQALKQKRLDLLISALDLMVPPLSLLVVFWLGLTLVTTFASILSSFWLPALLCYGTGAGLIIAITAVWYKFAQTDLPLQNLLNAPFYILWKSPLYFRFLTAPQVEWVRTHRPSQRKQNP